MGWPKRFLYGYEKSTTKSGVRSKSEKEGLTFCKICVCTSGSLAERKAESFEGTVDGDLCWPPRGEKGFGYDPIFLPKTGSQTFGEIEPELKHAISHRAEAFQKLTNSLSLR